MNDPNTARTVEKSAITPDRMALLHTLAFTALRLCTSQLDAFATRLDDALAKNPGATASEAGLCEKARQHLQSHRSTFQRLVADCLQRELMQSVQDAAEHADSGIESGAMDLSLITFDAMERKVIIDNLSQAIDRSAAEELAVLSLRIAHWLQAEEFGSAHNPFRSAVFLNAVADAWCTFDPSEESHRLVIRRWEPAVFLNLLPVWQALNQDLALRHVLPDAELVYRKRTKAPESILPAPAHEALRQWLAPEGMLKVIEKRAEVLADAMFQHLSSVEVIPAPIRKLLDCLRTPLKQAALDDTRFFFETLHPVRRMLESFLCAGLGCKPDGGTDLLLQTIEAGCARIPCAALAQSAVIANEFDTLAAREDRLAEARLSDAIAEAINQENVSQAERRAEQDILARIESGEVDDFIESFLQTQWQRVLVFAYGVREAKPDVLQKVLAAMDALLWSVQPKQSPEGRRELVERLPALLSMLNAWLNVVKWEGPDREEFFAAMAERHAAALRGTESGSRRALEIRMDEVQRASEHQLARRAQEQRNAALAPFIQEIDSLPVGTWFEFVRNNGSKMNCKLRWVSPARSRFIFSGRQGQLLFPLDRDDLAQGIRAQRVTRIPAGELVDRALTAALQKLSVA